jgi:alpha-D-ribose 1-methylphosphonate 5-triphosphate synthase subunit PhnH
MKSEAAMTATRIWQPGMQQQTFRGLLDAFSYPGRITACTDDSAPAWLAILSALVDGEVTLSDPQQLLSAGMWPRLEARRAVPETADFILLEGDAAPELLPCLGTLEAPEAGATLLICVASLHGDEPGELCLQLSGPGIRQPLTIGVDGLHPAWIEARNEWVSNFPLGVEIVLCDAHRFVALPRTTHIKTGAAA